MRVVWRVLRWVLIAVVTFSVASVATNLLTLSLLQHGRHLHAWMVWAILAVSFLIVWGGDRRLVTWVKASWRF